MRAFSRLLMLCAVLLPCAWLLWLNWGNLSLGRGGNAEQARIAEARTSPVYVLDRDDWLVFTLNGSDRLIRLLSNISLKPEEAGNRGAIWKYALEYQLLDDAGAVIDQRIYHHRGRVNWQQDVQDQPFTSSFYLTPERIPASAGEILIRPGNGQQASRLRVRLHSHDPLIVDAVMRVYQLEQVAEQKLDYMWHRLNEAQRTLLARGSVYGPDLLREQERHNLLRHRWRPVGPDGVNGRDYHSNILYSLQTHEGRILEEPVLPAGLLVEPDLRGIVPLPSEPGLVRLQFLPVQTTQTGDSEAPQLQIHWYGAGLAKRAQYRLQAGGEEFTFEHAFEGGLLEISGNRSLVVRASYNRPELDPDLWQEITPGPGYLRAYQAHPVEPLAFRVDHFENRATPFRVALRRKLITDPLADPGDVDPWPDDLVEYRLLDRHARLIRNGHLQLQGALSEYDQLLSDESAARVTEPVNFFIALPSEVSQILFFADEDVLISAYTRPAGIPAFSRIPEDSDLTGDKFARLPNWFLVQALEAKQLLQDKRVAVLGTQTRPPDDNEEILAGRYDWEDYLPAGNWLGRHILNPREPGIELRTDSYAGIYRELPSGDTQRLDFHGPANRQRLSPSLIYVRDSAAPFRLSLTRDGEPWLQQQLDGRRGLLNLPAIEQGEHRIRLQSDAGADARWLINYTGAGDKAHYKRMALRLGKQGLSFDYRKTGEDEEVLSVHVQPPMDHRLRSRLKVRISDRNRAREVFHTDWTLTHRIFDLAPSPEGPMPVLNTRDESVSLGRRFFLPLGCDLPEGDYRITFELEEGPDVYLSLYRLSPGVKERHEFHKEQIDEQE